MKNLALSRTTIFDLASVVQTICSFHYSPFRKMYRINARLLWVTFEFISEKVRLSMTRKLWQTIHGYVDAATRLS